MSLCLERGTKLNLPPCHPSPLPLYGPIHGSGVTRIRRFIIDPPGSVLPCKTGRGALVIEKRKRRMNAQELKTKTPDQLRDSLVALKKEAFNLRFQQATGQLENTSRMRAVRRDVARIKTVLNQKAAEAAAN